MVTPQFMTSNVDSLSLSICVFAECTVPHRSPETNNSVPTMLSQYLNELDFLEFVFFFRKLRSISVYFSRNECADFVRDSKYWELLFSALSLREKTINLSTQS